MKERLIILGGGPGIFDRADQLDADILLIDHPLKFDSQLASKAHCTLLCDYATDETFIEAVKAIHQKTPFDAVLCLTELGLLPAATLADALGLQALPPSVVARIRNKFEMREWLAAANFPSVEAAIGTSTECVRKFAISNGYPIILKPIDGLGSIGIVRLNEPADLEKVSLPGTDFLIEECLSGREISVETFSFHGQHVILALTQKMLNHGNAGNPYVEVGHKMPADLANNEVEDVERYVASFLDLMGITDGCAHTELIITERGPRIIETHNRVGGGNIPQLVRLTTGVDLLQLSVAWPLGKCAPISRPERRQLIGAAVRFFSPEPGVVTRIVGMEKWKGTPGVVSFHFPYKVGDEIRPMVSSFDRQGFVIATGPNAAEAESICNTVMDGIEIHTIGQ
ncbi:ATP-grasp domain-containing protein [Paraburkholderia strydomiana]|uniref:ATP-grasp domain-containing protein n=1 Tax=Paraburkholderia strydomiana TaxID=1245417 RepID=A0ABW9EE64_9BURK